MNFVWGQSPKEQREAAQAAAEEAAAEHAARMAELARRKADQDKEKGS